MISGVDWWREGGGGDSGCVSEDMIQLVVVTGNYWSL